MFPLNLETFERGISGAPDWVAEYRRRGYEYFEKQAMPTGAEEEWRYVALDFDLADFSLPEAGGEELPARALVAADNSIAGRAVVSDGFVGSIEESSSGAVFVSLAGALSAHPDAARRALDGQVKPDVDIFAAAHQAFGSDGIVLQVPAGVAVSAPFVIEVQSTQEGTVSFPRVSVDLADNAEASVIILFRSPDEIRSVVSPQLIVTVGDGARLNLTTAQHWGAGTASIAHLHLSLGRDATARIGEIGLGAKLGRLDVDMDLVGDGSSSELVGLYFGDHTQILDYRVVINHHGKRTTSDVFLKGAVEDEAQSVFSGLLKIWPDAVRTSTFETNRNLVLSEGAKAHSVPNLEILCDDVMCGHGSSVGQLEEEHLYYLMSRGLSEERASRVLVRGFFEEVIERLPTEGLAESTRQAVNQKYTEALREGRV